MTDKNTLKDLHEEMKSKFSEHNALHIFQEAIAQDEQRLQAALTTYDGDKEAVEELIDQYQAARRALQKEDELNSWSGITELYEDSNTKKTAVHSTVAEFLMDNFDFMTPRDTENVWRFANPAYKQDGERFIKEQMFDNINTNISTRDVREVSEEIRSRTGIEREDERAPERYIALKNGWYDTEERALVDPKPEYFMTNSIPVDYDEEAECPQFLEFVNDIVPTEDDVKIIQEMFGYCMYRGYPLHKAFMLLGPGSNGKTTLLEILQAMLGKDNVSNESLHNITNSRWGSAQLYRKLANIDDDLNARRLQDAADFKKLVGGASLSAEYKGQDKFDFKNYAKLVFAANELPATPDTNPAFFRRWIILKFPNQYTHDPNDGLPNVVPDLDKKILDAGELPGILQWALEGLERLLENKEFTYSRSRESIKNEWMLRTQPVDVFFENAMERKAGSTIGKDELYQHYVKFAELFGVEQRDRSQFFKGLYNAYPELKDSISRPRSDSSRPQQFHGVTTKELEQVVKVVQGKIESNGGAHAHTPAYNPDSVCTTLTTLDEVVELVKELDEGDGVPIEDIEDHASDSGIDIEGALKKLENEGRIYEPRPGFVKKL